MPVQTVIKKRRDTAANWTSTNPVLAAGEAGLESDTGLVKHGDGTTAWASLPYQKTGVPAGGTANQILTKVNGSNFNTTWTNSLAAVDSISFNTAPTGVPVGAGVLSWNSVDKTLDLQSEGITYQLGQELAQNVKKFDSTGLTNGKVVYVKGSTGANILVEYAIATSDVTSASTIGVMTASASAAASAPMTTFGLVRNIDTSALTEGAVVYLSASVAGDMTTTKPAAPAHMVQVGYCVRSHATEGVIFVNVKNGFELDELHDVAIATPTNKQVLQYETSTGLWKNATISAGVTVSDTAPSSPSVGDQWYNSVEGRTYVYYDSFWVDSNPGIVGPAGTNGTNGGFDSTQTIAMLASGITLSSVDAGKLYMNSGACTVTVQGLSVGQQVDFVQTNAGQITFAAGAGMTLNSKGGLLKTAAQYSPATIKCLATNSYVLLGDLGA